MTKKSLDLRIVLVFVASMLAFSLSFAADAVIKDAAGQVVNLKKHPNQWLMINYWAPWCGSCRQEIPELNKFYATHQKQVLLYGVDYDLPSSDALPALAKKMHIHYPLLADDPRDVLAITDTPALPITFVYDPSGNLHTTLYGPQTQHSLTKAIQPHE